MKPDKHQLNERKLEVAEELQDSVEGARELALELGLNPWPVNYWVVDQEEMYMLISYQGYSKRYPHWRWGETYMKQKAKGKIGAGKALEIVNNNNPAHAFLQQSNSLTEQKSVITHVEAHSDFFRNNKWFTHSNTVDILTRHAEKIEEIINDENVDREKVEKWIDNIISIQDTINQYEEIKDKYSQSDDESVEEKKEQIRNKIESLGLREEVEDGQFTEEWIERQAEKQEEKSYVRDVVGFLRDNGMQYDEESGKAKEFEPWQREIISILQEEAQIFAPQKMTRTMNEGWASFWQSIMMSSEGFVSDEEILQYADSQSVVLNDTEGTNPYKLGVELWRYIENKENRKEVVGKILRVDGIDWKNFHKKVDPSLVIEKLNKPKSDDPAVRNFSLLRPKNRSFLMNISKGELEEIHRYIFDDKKYDTIEEALENVDYNAGWDKMFRVRESHNDITFIDTFLDQEFAERYNYFTYEYSSEKDEMRISSRNAEDIKKKLLLELTNFGKPQIWVEDGNYKNRNELLLAHNYNGVMLNLSEAKETLKNVYELWGRPVNLKTIYKEGENDEVGILLRYDGNSVVEETALNEEEVEDIKATSIDYDTKPDEWI